MNGARNRKARANPGGTGLTRKEAMSLPRRAKRQAALLASWMEVDDEARSFLADSMMMTFRLAAELRVMRYAEHALPIDRISSILQDTLLQFDDLGRHASAWESIEGICLTLGRKQVAKDWSPPVGNVFRAFCTAARDLLRAKRPPTAGLALLRAWAASGLMLSAFVDALVGAAARGQKLVPIRWRGPGIGLARRR